MQCSLMYRIKFQMCLILHLMVDLFIYLFIYELTFLKMQLSPFTGMGELDYVNYYCCLFVFFIIEIFSNPHPDLQKQAEML